MDDDVLCIERKPLYFDAIYRLCTTQLEADIRDVDFSCIRIQSIIFKLKII